MNPGCITGGYKLIGTCVNEIGGSIETDRVLLNSKLVWNNFGGKMLINGVEKQWNTGLSMSGTFSKLTVVFRIAVFCFW